MVSRWTAPAAAATPPAPAPDDGPPTRAARRTARPAAAACDGSPYGGGGSPAPAGEGAATPGAGGAVRPPLGLAALDGERVDRDHAQLWAHFVDTRDPRLREKLIVLYAPLVKHVAARVAAMLPRHADRADLVSSGAFGLIHAVDRFDPTAGVKFETYAAPRIRGAIIDELRDLDWAPRSVRARAKAISAVHDEFYAQQRRAATSTELAERLDVTPAEIDTSLALIDRANPAALDELATGGADGGLTLADLLTDTLAEDPQRSVEDTEVRFVLARAVNALPDRDKLIVTLYYYEGLSMAQIGRVLGVTESRICQLNTIILTRLRTALTGALGTTP